MNNVQLNIYQLSRQYKIKQGCNSNISEAYGKLSFIASGSYTRKEVVSKGLRYWSRKARKENEKISIN